MAILELFFYICLHSRLASDVRHMTIHIRLRVTRVDVSINSGFFRAVDEHLGVIDDLVTGDLEVVEANPVSGYEQAAALKCLCHLFWVLEVEGVHFHFKAGVGEGVWLWLINIVEVDDAEILGTESLDELVGDVAAGVARGAGDGDLLLGTLTRERSGTSSVIQCKS